MNDEELAAELTSAATADDDRASRARRAAGAIRRVGGYRWVGIYDVGTEEISVVGWDGPAPPTHRAFPRTRGLCGAAVAVGKPVVVGDVSADPRYLMTHATTRSEIVIPVFVGPRVVGVIDVESEEPDAFGDDDTKILERCAAVIALLFG
jgi:L-methionine (R)-S-oxide reductase